MQDVFGVISNGVHIDASNTLRGAKCFATRNGYSTVSIRYNGGYIAKEVATKRGGKWVNLTEGQIRYNK